MGQKLSTNTSHWSVDDWAFGTANNAVPIEEVIVGARQIPLKYFGGNVVQNDSSMQQMQQELLSFDDALKHVFFWRKKNKGSKKTRLYEEEYHAEDEQYYDQAQPPIPEEDEPPLPPIYVDRNEQTTYQNSSWRCRNCGAQNRSIDTKCSECKGNEARF